MTVEMPFRQGSPGQVRAPRLSEDVTTPCDLIVDEHARSGAVNMAFDAALLQIFSNAPGCVVRVYRWSQPTVTVGYFQDPVSCRDVLPGSLPVVRRLTGGGAILHDRELTYSCVVPVRHPLHSDPVRLYARIHGAIVQLLQDCGLPCRLRSADPDSPSVPRGLPVTGLALPSGLPSSAQPFLCFLRQDPNDIVCTSGEPQALTRKIAGSAQRRRRGTVLQHGSILLRTAGLTPQLPGIVELCPGFNEESFVAALPEQIASVLSLSVRQRHYSAEEKNLAEVLCNVAGNIG